MGKKDPMNERPCSGNSKIRGPVGNKDGKRGLVSNFKETQKLGKRDFLTSLGKEEPLRVFGQDEITEENECSM